MSGAAPDQLVNREELEKFLVLIGAQNTRTLLHGQNITNGEMDQFMSHGSPNTEQSLGTINSLVNYMATDTDYDSRLQATRIAALRNGADPFQLPTAIESTPGASRAEYLQNKLGFVPGQYSAKRPGQQQSGAARMAPAVGYVQGGYRFKGGNPADKANWEKQ